MSGEKDLDQLKKEAAEKAKELAKQRRAAMASGETKTEKVVTEKSVATEEAPKPTSEDADMAKKKAAAAAKAKAAALAKMKASGQVAEEAPAEGEDADMAKKKAAAAAKAKAAALAKMKASGQVAEEAPAEGEDADLAKKKAAAVAKAKAAAAAKAKAAAQAGNTAGGDDEKAKAIAAAKAKAAAAAAAKAKTGGAKTEEAPAVEQKTSPNQPYLDKYVKVITENLGDHILEDSYINPLSKDVPTLVANRESYYRLAEFLKYNERLGFDYLSELHGTDFQTHMEVYVHLYSYKNRQSVALKVKLDRNEPITQSVVPLWAGADWPECETYDLLGIKFEGHPNLHRIMLGEDWVGHPLRKDYEPYDVEV